MILALIAILFVPIFVFRVVTFFIFKAVSTNREEEPLKFNIGHTLGFGLLDTAIVVTVIPFMNDVFKVETVIASQLSALVCIAVGFATWRLYDKTMSTKDSIILTVVHGVILFGGISLLIIGFLDIMNF